MREAVAQMKQELGENAVILHTKKYKDGGFLGVGSREMIELTAAIEDEKPAKKELPTEKIEPPSVKVRPPSIVSQYKTSGTAEGYFKISPKTILYLCIPDNGQKSVKLFCKFIDIFMRKIQLSIVLIPIINILYPIQQDKIMNSTNISIKEML